MPEYICPHCGKPIYDDEALRCLYCGESLNRGFGFLGSMKYSAPRLGIIAGVLLVLLSFIIFMVLR